MISMLNAVEYQRCFDDSKTFTGYMYKIARAKMIFLRSETATKRVTPSLQDIRDVSSVANEVHAGRRTYFPLLFSASCFIPACTQARLLAACSSILALSFRSSFIVCGSGTWRPFSTPGRAVMRSSQALRAGKSSMLTPAQPAAATQP